MGEVVFNTHRQKSEFVDKQGSWIDLAYVIYHESHNKCYYFTDTSELKSRPLSGFPLMQNLSYVRTGTYIFQSQI